MTRHPVRPAWLRNPAGFSLGLLGLIGLLLMALAASAIWLSAVEPVATAISIAAVRQGDVGPLVKSLAGLLYAFVKTIVRYI